VVKKDRFSVRQ